MDKTEKKLKENVIYNGRILTFYNDEVMCPNGHESKREYVHHPGGACILALIDGYIYFEKQYRYPLRKEILELPAGKLDKGEDPKHAAIRELEEEIGYKSLEIEKMGEIYPSVGYTDEVIHLYYSPINVKTNTNPDEDELIEIVKLKPEEAYYLLDKGEIRDAKTICLLEKLRPTLLRK